MPQSSVLRPLLFLIYVKDLSNLKLSIGSSVERYADDILLYRSVASVSDFEALQNGINKIQTLSQRQSYEVQ